MSRNWANIGRPLRPGAEDIRLFRTALEGWPDTTAASAVRAIILGVTPELHDLAQDLGVQVLAVDQNPDMIRAIWPGQDGSAILSDWRDVPLPDASADVVMCDGGLHLLPYPAGQQALIAEIARLVRRGGRVAFRLFLPAEHGETPDAVLADLDAGSIPNLNCLKLRLGTAMMSSSEEGVCLHDIWSRLRSHYHDAEWPAVAAQLGWTLEHLEVIDSYRASATRYHFVSLEQVLHLFTAGDEPCFELAALTRPGSIMGDRCPVVSFRRI